LSRLHYKADAPNIPVVVGPFIGAPYAVMLFEILRAWGIQEIIFLGWCGTIDETVPIGNIILPTGALIDEGTSVQYGQCGNDAVQTDDTLRCLLKKGLSQCGIDYISGVVWTTDAIFRETRTQVQKFQQLGALAVEMELSALLSAGRFYNLPIAAILIVSDELFTFQWRQGFRSEKFRQSRIAICKAVAKLFSSSNKGKNDC
jgi:purine-nucleoside phosphorylase